MFLRYKSALIVGFLFSLSSLSLFAADSALTEIKSLLEPITALNAIFTQTVKSEQGRVLQQLSGKMALKKPGQFRWEILKPDPRLVVSDGKQVWDYDKDLAQVTVQTVKTGQNKAPIFFLTGEVSSLEKDFNVKKLPNKGKQGTCLQESDACFELTPKQPSQSFQWIRVGFRAKQLRELELLDQLGQDSRFIFKDVVLNGKNPVTLFQFSAPKGVDVLKND